MVYGIRYGLTEIQTENGQQSTAAGELSQHGILPEKQTAAALALCTPGFTGNAGQAVSCYAMACHNGIFLTADFIGMVIFSNCRSDRAAVSERLD